MAGRASGEARAKIMEAMLEACGERGYRNATVQDALERSGAYRLQFYRLFANKADCYLAAYEVESLRLTKALLAAGRAEESWRPGLHAALRELSRYAVERPALARGVLVEVHVADHATRLKRLDVFKRLSRAVDSARRETRSRHLPPPLTSQLIVGAIESAVTSALVEGEPQRFEAAIPELIRIAVAAYFGDAAAGESARNLRSL